MPPGPGRSRQGRQERHIESSILSAATHLPDLGGRISVTPPRRAYICRARGPPLPACGCVASACLKRGGICVRCSVFLTSAGAACLFNEPLSSVWALPLAWLCCHATRLPSLPCTSTRGAGQGPYLPGIGPRWVLPICTATDHTHDGAVVTGPDDAIGGVGRQDPSATWTKSRQPGMVVCRFQLWCSYLTYCLHLLPRYTLPVQASIHETEIPYRREGSRWFGPPQLGVRIDALGTDAITGPRGGKRGDPPAGKHTIRCTQYTHRHTYVTIGNSHATNPAGLIRRLPCHAGSKLRGGGLAFCPPALARARARARALVLARPSPPVVNIRQARCYAAGRDPMDVRYFDAHGPVSCGVGTSRGPGTALTMRSQQQLAAAAAAAAAAPSSFFCLLTS